MSKLLCACGRPLDAGWTGGARGVRCLICETARIFAGWRWTRKGKAR